MKAYYVDIKDDPDQGANVVFANTVREARKYTGDLQYDSWLDVQCRRYPQFDGLENLSERELALKKWREGWWFDSDEPMFTDDEETTDQDFLDWWDGKHVKCDNNGGAAIGAGHECKCLKRKGHYGKHACSCGGIW